MKPRRPSTELTVEEQDAIKTGLFSLLSKNTCKQKRLKVTSIIKEKVVRLLPVNQNAKRKEKAMY